MLIYNDAKLLRISENTVLYNFANVSLFFAIETIVTNSRNLDLATEIKKNTFFHKLYLMKEIFSNTIHLLLT